MFIWKRVEYPNLTFDRTTNQLIRNNGKPLAICIDSKGYQYYGMNYNGKQQNIRIHRLIYWMYHPLTSFDLQIDHIDRNKINNDLSNLRLATYSENNCNKTKKPNTSSKYKNVYWFKRGKKWQTAVKVNYKSSYIGIYDSQREAAIAYNNYIIQNNLVTEFRTLNIIEPRKQVTITIKQ